MHSIKTTTLLWASLCGALALGACVDTNVAKPSGDDTMTDPPCGLGADGKAIKPFTAAVFTGATGTPTLHPENKPPAVPDVFFTTPDKDGKPEAIAEGSEGVLTSADFCPAKDFEVTAWLGSDFTKPENKLGSVKTGVVDKAKPFMLVSYGLIKADAWARHGQTGTAPAFGIAVVDVSKFAVDAKGDDDPAKTQVLVVHASTLLAAPATVKVGATDAVLTTRGAFTAPVDVAEPDKALKLAFTAGADTKTVTIGPRFPKSTKGIAILFDTLDNDPDVKGADVPDPSSQLFLTGDDPLLSALPATGVTFPVDE